MAEGIAWCRCGAASTLGDCAVSPSAGPPGIHVTDVARELEIERVIVPR